MAGSVNFRCRYWRVAMPAVGRLRCDVSGNGVNSRIPKFRWKQSLAARMSRLSGTPVKGNIAKQLAPAGGHGNERLSRLGAEFSTKGTPCAGRQLQCTGVLVFGL